jgi:hypothetical protein
MGALFLFSKVRKGRMTTHEAILNISIGLFLFIAAALIFINLVILSNELQ